MLPVAKQCGRVACPEALRRVWHGCVNAKQTTPIHDSACHSTRGLNPPPWFDSRRKRPAPRAARGAGPKAAGKDSSWCNRQSFLWCMRNATETAGVRPARSSDRAVDHRQHVDDVLILGGRTSRDRRAVTRGTRPRGTWIGRTLVRGNLRRRSGVSSSAQAARYPLPPPRAVGRGFVGQLASSHASCAVQVPQAAARCCRARSRAGLPGIPGRSAPAALWRSKSRAPSGLFVVIAEDLRVKNNSRRCRRYCEANENGAIHGLVAG